jgi:hypothetical protein
MSTEKAKTKIATYQFAALLIAIGETMINKNVSIDEAQGADQRGYLVSRMTMNGLSVEEAETIAAAGLSGVEIASADGDKKPE